MASRISSAEIGPRPEGVVVAISAAGREPVGEPAGPSTLIIRRLERDESSGRKGSSTGGGPGSSRLRRSSRCTRKDSIRRNRAQSDILQTLSAKSTSAEPTATEASMKTTTVEAASAETASMPTIAAASGRHRRLNQAVSRSANKAINISRTMLPPLGQSRSQRSDPLRSEIIRQSKGVRGQLTVSEADRSSIA
jgi:hypothetical protein